MANIDTTDTSTGWVPQDTFGARLALVRQARRWNISEAAEACGLIGESWRNWEHGRPPRSMNEVVVAISEATGCDREWLMWGGPLTSPFGSAGAVTRRSPTFEPTLFDLPTAA